MEEFDQIDILLVEDNPLDAELTMRGLRNEKLANRITWVKDGEEALDYVFRRGAYASRADSGPRLILLDLKMPRVGGIEVTRAIKSNEKTRRIPIVIMTSSKERDRRHRQLQPRRQQLHSEASGLRVACGGRSPGGVLLAGDQPGADLAPRPGPIQPVDFGSPLPWRPARL